MELLEYQAKQLFRTVGIPVLPSQTIREAAELKQLEIPYPVVLKSQVRAGGRGRAGGVRFAENTIDAIAAARAIFGLSILGERPDVLLAEARYNAQQELYLAIVLDYQRQRPVLLGSACGGIDLESLLQNLQSVVIVGEFSPFYARRLAIQMGLAGPLIQSLSAIVAKMYRLFRDRDLDMIEINPLGVDEAGRVMALDGKITANDRAIARHSDLLALRVDADPAASLVVPCWLDSSASGSGIAIICNSGALALAAGDALAQAQQTPVASYLVGISPQGQRLDPTQLLTQLDATLQQAIALAGLKVLLVNILSDVETSQIVVQALSQRWQPQLSFRGEERLSRPTGSSAALQRFQPLRPQREPELPALVVRLSPLALAALSETATLPVCWCDGFEQAIAQTLALGNSCP